MTRNPVFVHPDVSVTEARSLMDREKIGRLPVLDKNNVLVGIITSKDLLGVFINAFGARLGDRRYTVKKVTGAG
jgi:CBS domain-containing protein